MPSILVATGFVRIDADTKPALKAIQALGSIGGNVLSTAIGPAAAAATTAVAAVGASFATAAGAAGIYGVAVKQQFAQIAEASEKQATAEEAKTKATNQTAIAQRLAKENGFQYGKAVEITASMTDEARDKAEDYNAALSASKSATKAARESQEAYKAKLAEMPPATRQTAEAMQNLKDSTKSWSDSLSGSTMPVFTRGIQFLEGLLPKLTPIVKDVAREIDSFAGTLGEGTAGKVFREFGENVKGNGAGALRSFLNTGRDFVVGVVGILNAFTPMSDGVTGGLEDMMAKFAEWGASLSTNEGFGTFTSIAQEAGPKLVDILGKLGSAFVKIASAAGPMAGVGLQLLDIFAGLVDAIPTPVLRLLVPTILAVNTAMKLYALYQAASTAATWLFSTAVTTSTGQVATSRAALIAFRIQQISAAVATGVVTAAQWAWNAAMSANPIGLVVLALVALGAGLFLAWKKSETFRNIVKGALGAVKDVAVAVGNWFAGPFARFFTETIPGAFRTVLNWVRTNWPWILGALTGPIGLAVVFIIKHWDDIKRGLAAAWEAIKRNVLIPIKNFFTQTVPGWARFLRDKVVSFFRGVLDGWVGIYKSLQDRVFTPIRNFFTSTIPGWARFLRDKVVSFFRGVLDGWVGIYNSIKSRVLNPLNRFFTVHIPGGARAMKDKVVSFFRGVLDGWQGIYNSIKNRIFSPLGRFFTSTIPGWARGMKDKVVGFFRSMRDGLGTAWNGIKSKAKTPINWVIDHVWNRGIQNIWGKITGWIGIKNSLKDIKLLASGGTVGNTPMGVFNRPTAIVGEGNPSHPEFVIPTDPKYRSRALALYQAAGVHFMADGGILGSIGGWLSNAASSVGSAVKGAADFLSDPVGKAKKLLLGAMKGVGSLGSSPWVKMITDLPRKAVDGLISAVKKVGSSFLGGIGLGPSGGSGVKRWTSVVQTALRHVGQPLAYTDTTLRRMNQESGGNPNIVNKWDSNWKAGHPSVGLMQVIGPTFRAYAGKMRNVGPFLYGTSVNPLANVYSSMRYALAAYGSLPRAYNRAGGYELGTDGATSGWHWVGEHEPELMKLPAGTRIRSGRASARQASAVGTAVVHLTVENHGVIASRQEAEDWLVGSLETLRVKRRLPAALGGTP